MPLVNKEKALDKITSADQIETKKHKPDNIKMWCKVFQDFESANEKSWHRIFKLPFVVLRHTKIQTFHYKVLHRVLPYKWLYNIKIKDYEICEYCNDVDDIVYFFLKCSKIWDFCNVIFTTRNLVKQNLQFITTNHKAFQNNISCYIEFENRVGIGRDYFLSFIFFLWLII